MTLVWSLQRELERLRLPFWSHLEERLVWSDTKIPSLMRCSGSPFTTTTARTTSRILDYFSRCFQFHRTKRQMLIRFIANVPKHNFSKWWRSSFIVCTIIICKPVHVPCGMVPSGLRSTLFPRIQPAFFRLENKLSWIWYETKKFQINTTTLLRFS